MTILDRLLQNKVDGEPFLGVPCWLWVGAITGAGYGSVWWQRKYVAVHRASYEYHIGPISKGMMVLHKCDVRNCFNPDHLIQGTCKDNIRDAHRKGRAFIARGSLQGQAILIEEDVIKIKEMLDDRIYSHREIAEIYGVTRATITAINMGKNWSWL